MKQFSDALLLIHSSLDLESIPHSTLQALERVLPGDCFAYNEYHQERVVNLSTPNQLDPATMEAFQTYIGEHPALDYLLRTGTRSAVRLSDFASHRQWQKTNLFNLVFRPTNFRYQVGCHFPIQGASTASFSINASARDFTTEHRQLMTLFGQHFIQAWRRAALLSRKNAALSLVAITEVDSAGRIHFSTERADALLARFHPGNSSGRRVLPEPFRTWLRQNIAAASDLRVFRPLDLTTGNERLTVMLAAAADAGRYQLLFDVRRQITPTDLAAHFSLTPRQAEVLFWLAEGKSNEEIAMILGAKPRTIAKHVENILARLGVENRSTATRLCQEAAGSLRW